MPKFNIYKILPGSYNRLLSKLADRQLVKTSERLVNSCKLEFYFSKEPDVIKIWWTEVYRDFLRDFLQGEQPPKNSVYYAVLLISDIDRDHVYAVSLGKTHFYLREFADKDFGLQLAERIIDHNNVLVKNGKFYKSKRSKSITSYQLDNLLLFETGESLEYIRAKTNDEKLWGKVASFGTSVQLNIDIKPEDLPQIIETIEEKIRETPAEVLPRAETVKEREIEMNLDQQLIKAITNSSSSVNIEPFTLSGVDFIFTEGNQYRFSLKRKRKSKSSILELSIPNLLEFIRLNQIPLERLNDVNVIVENEHKRGHRQPVKEFLDCMFEDGNSVYSLIGGKWHRFNLKLIEDVRTKVDKIRLDIYEDKYDVSKGVKEDEFNRNRESEGYENWDKKLISLGWGYKVEKADLYKDETLFFVKMGTPQDLTYVVDQAITSVRQLQLNKANFNSENISVKKICLWIILKRKTQIDKLSKLESIIFLLKLVEWQRVVADAGSEPIIRINYKKDE